MSPENYAIHNHEPSHFFTVDTLSFPYGRAYISPEKLEIIAEVLKAAAPQPTMVVPIFKTFRANRLD